MRVVVAVGGTGGHLIPASQLAKKLLNRNIPVLFAGKGLKVSQCFEKSEVSFVEIASSSILKKKIFSTLFSLSKGVAQSLRLLRKEKPNVVIGFGSYHSFPVLFAARLLRIPIVLYESNRILGKVNRLFAPKAQLVAIQFPLLNPPQTGTVVQVPYLPWKKEEISKGSFGLDSKKFTFLIFGGSQGAAAINEAFLKCSILLKDEILFQVIHFTGKDEEAIKAFYEEQGIEHYVKEFEPRMDLAYQAADIVICRSGASTVAELIQHEKPSILIPFPSSSENHQEKNADFMAQSVSGGIKILESELSNKSLMDAILALNEKEKKAAIQKFKKEETDKSGLDEWILKIMTTIS